MHQATASRDGREGRRRGGVATAWPRPGRDERPPTLCQGTLAARGLLDEPLARIAHQALGKTPYVVNCSARVQASPSMPSDGLRWPGGSDAAAALKAILALCDDVRDETMAELVSAAVKSKDIAPFWKLAEKEELRRERDRVRLEAEAKMFKKKSRSPIRAATKRRSKVGGRENPPAGHVSLPDGGVFCFR